MTLNEIYQEFLDLPYYQKVLIGQDCVATLKKFFEKNMAKYGAKKKEDAWIVLLGSLRPFIGADRVFDVDEYKFICEVFELGVDYDTFLNLYNTVAFREVSLTNMYRSIIQTAEQEVRFAYVRLGILVCAADDTLTYVEQREIEKMLF